MLVAEINSEQDDKFLEVRKATIVLNKGQSIEGFNISISDSQYHLESQIFISNDGMRDLIAKASKSLK